MQFLLNIPLKYKFWLVNMVSFVMALALVVYAMAVHTHSVQDHDHSRLEQQLGILLAAGKNLSEEDFRAILPASAFVLAQGQSASKLEVPDQVRAMLAGVKSSTPEAQLAEPDLLNLVDSAYWYMAAYSPELQAVVGLMSATASYGHTFVSQAPGYAVAVLVLMVGLLIVSQMLISFIERHVNRLRETMMKVQKENDLTLRVNIDCRDEIGQMAEAFNQMQAGYQHTVSNLRDSASRLGEEVLHLTKAAADTNQQMERQQQETDQVVTAMHQMTAAAQEVAQNASGTHEVSEIASGKASVGNERVQQTRDAILKLSDEILAASHLIEQLNENSHRIESATNQIQTISEQTNLLALNAAIEAARAGSVGRGFAVVADEVRNLARHAHEASGAINQVVASIRQVAEQVTETMESSRAMANSCVERAEDAAIELQEINQVVEQIKDKNLMIATAAEEQSQVSETISDGLRAIREDTMKTSVNAGAVLRSGNEIRSQADRLIKLVESMRV